jgi:hypothetical protein
VELVSLGAVRAIGRPERSPAVQRPSFSLRLIGLWPTSFEPKRKSPLSCQDSCPKGGKTETPSLTRNRANLFFNSGISPYYFGHWFLVPGSLASLEQTLKHTTWQAVCKSCHPDSRPSVAKFTTPSHPKQPSRRKKRWKVCDASTTSTCKPEHRDAVEALSTLALTQGYASHR